VAKIAGQFDRRRRNQLRTPPCAERLGVDKPEHTVCEFGSADSLARWHTPLREPTDDVGGRGGMRFQLFASQLCDETVGLTARLAELLGVNPKFRLDGLEQQPVVLRPCHLRYQRIRGNGSGRPRWTTTKSM
jgi:hypothetical protein